MQLSAIALSIARASHAFADPLALFASGEQGIWLDPSDFSTLFQDSAGTTPVTAIGQPVGLALDKSGRGNHASQTTSASRPTVEARVNRFTYSQDFSAWVKDECSVTSSTVPSFDGSASAFEVTGSANTGVIRRIRQPITMGTSPSTQIFRVKKGTQRYVQFYLINDGAPYANYDLEAGTVATSGGASASISAVGNGYYDLTFTVTSTAPTAIFGYLGFIDSMAATRAATHSTGATTLYMAQADLRLSLDSAYPYQRVNTATDYVDVGAPRYLQFDGTDDSMIAGAASTFNFLHNNLGATVFCGYMPSGTSVYHAIVATGNLGSAGVVGFTLGQDDRTVGVTYNIIANGSGTLFVNSNPTTGVTASKRVVSIVNASGKHITRKNAVQISAATETGSASPANSAYGLNIGRTGAGLTPLNGRIYQLIIRGAESNAGQIAATEAYVNAKTRAY